MEYDAVNYETVKIAIALPLRYNFGYTRAMKSAISIPEN